MRIFFVLFAILVVTYAQDDTQYVKSVKGGGSNYQDRVTDYWHRFNNTKVVDNRHEEEDTVGVCYIEIPTINLVNDPRNVPVGNGSRSDLSRIRSCCAGYTRNRHNAMICDPVCSKECTNALCVAPETCRCYPDYVKNRAGFCVPTCPIGCQNGYCAGGECICNSGYELDRDGKFCAPMCGNMCRLGNCTAPNTCTPTSTPGGSYRPGSPVCNDCNFGQCIDHQTCRCYPGYIKNNQGKCTPHCSVACVTGSSCVAPNVCSPTNTEPRQYEMTPITTRPIYPASQVTNSPTNGTPNVYPQTHYGSPASPRPGDHSQTDDRNRDTTEPNQYQSHYYPPSPPPPRPGQPQPHNQYGQREDTTRPNQPYYPYPTSQRPDSHNPNINRGDVEPLPNQDTQSYPGQQRPDQYPTSPNYKPINIPYYPYPTMNSTDQGPNRYPYYPGSQMPNSTYPNQGSVYPGPPNSYYNQPTNGSPYPGFQQPYPQGSNPNQRPYQGNDFYNHNYQSSGQNFEFLNQVSNQSRSANQSYTLYSRENGYNPIYTNQDTQQTAELTSICSLPCTNGYCVEGNECRCNPGYIPDRTDPGRCLPHCPGGCSNGVCSAPHMCLCNVGYHKDTGVKGRQVCVKEIR